MATGPDRKSRLEAVLIRPEAMIAAAIQQLDYAGTGALVLCTEDRKLCGLLTDGDIRRAFLRGVPFERPCSEICTRQPQTATRMATNEDILALMNRQDVNHIPVVDGEGHILNLVLRRDLTPTAEEDASAVIMAGGFGRRLLPLTKDVPKPMLRVGGRPLMEITIERLRKAGFRHVNVTTHHLSDRITRHFGDGSAFGVELHYVSEEEPLGTAGGLRLTCELNGPLLVINGDILSDVDFQNILAFHQEHHADLTVGVHRQAVEIPYGVVECDGPYVRAIREKPSWEVLVNAGIYMLEPGVRHFIPPTARFDMTDLIARLIAAGRKVVSFPIVEYWIDIGVLAQYEQAQADYTEGKIHP
jgi:dTDP-glucose pyrophosphorylase